MKAFLILIFLFAVYAGAQAPQGYSPIPVNGAPSPQGQEPQTPPAQVPSPSPTPNSFQDPSDLANAVGNVQKYDANSPQYGPNYPPISTLVKPTKNLIENVSPKPVEDKKVFATVFTSMGNFKIKLYPQYVPRTVKNFTDLATGQKEFVEAATSRKSTRPFYNGQIIFRVIKDFVIQMGCPFGDGRGGPGYEISDEFTPYLHHNKAGMVSMANHGPNTGGSQFFITLKAQPKFDDKYSVFGEVVQGMDVINKIAKVRTGPTSRPLKRIVVQKIEVEGI